MSGQTEERLAKLQEVCRARGIPLTNQRRAVLEVLLQRCDHPTADQVFEAVKANSPQISRRTVYRVLDTLVQLELSRRVHHQGAVARFDARVGRHHHLVCIRCDKIVDLESAELDSITLPRGKPGGFEIRELSVQILGICSECCEGEKK